MENTVFKLGDVVKLKSGGLDMTIDKFVYNPVAKINYTDKVECVWFDKNTLKRETFQTTTIELVEVVLAS